LSRIRFEQFRGYWATSTLNASLKIKKNPSWLRSNAVVVPKTSVDVFDLGYVAELVTLNKQLVCLVNGTPRHADDHDVSFNC